MMRLVMSGTGDAFEGVSVRKLLESAERHGIDTIDLWYPKNVKVDGLDRSVRSVQDRGFGVAVISTWTHLFWPGDVSEQQRLLIEGIELAHRLGAGIVNTYFGHGTERDDNTAIETYAKNLEPCLTRAEALDVTLCLENEFDVLNDDPSGSDITRRPKRIRELVRRVDSPNFRTTFDACNFYFAGVEPYPYAYELLRETIGYVHLKDGARYAEQQHNKGWLRFTDHEEKYVCLSLGKGAINYHGLLAALDTDGYAGLLCLEPHVEEGRLQRTYEETIAYLETLGVPT